MTGFVEDALMRAEGLTDADIATVNAELPDIRKLDALLIENWPLIARVVSRLAPIFDKIVAEQQQLK